MGGKEAGIFNGFTFKPKRPRAEMQSQPRRIKYTIIFFNKIGLATQAKPDMGHGKTYQVPEFFGYNAMSYFDIEKTMVAQRVPQPSSGLSEYWGDADKGKQ